jgi:uncharacterized protein YndB with AHSA1/START domain
MTAIDATGACYRARVKRELDVLGHVLDAMPDVEKQLPNPEETTTVMTTFPAKTTTTRMSAIRVARVYPHPPAKVWRALTEPGLMALWGMRPEGYSPIVGTRFRLLAKPNFAWRGFVECEVLEAREPSVISYAWDDDGKGNPTRVTYVLEPLAGGTRLIVEHTGFTGVSGIVFANLVMAPGLREMVETKLPAVLGDLDDERTARPGGPSPARGVT